MYINLPLICNFNKLLHTLHDDKHNNNYYWNTNNFVNYSEKKSIYNNIASHTTMQLAIYFPLDQIFFFDNNYYCILISIRNMSCSISHWIFNELQLTQFFFCLLFCIKTQIPCFCSYYWVPSITLLLYIGWSSILLVTLISSIILTIGVVCVEFNNNYIIIVKMEWLSSVGIATR